MKYMRFVTASALAIVMIAASGAAAQVTASPDSVILENKVQKELKKLPYYGVFDHIAFEVKGNTVILSGKVLNAINRGHAESYVGSIEGVAEVVNNIELLPPSSFDDGIRRRTVRAFANGGSVYRYLQGPNPSMRIIVDGGRLTLEGVVSSDGDVRFANILAKGIPGVFEVKNNLTVASDRP